MTRCSPFTAALLLLGVTAAASTGHASGRVGERGNPIRGATDTLVALPNAQKVTAGRLTNDRLEVALDVVNVLVQPDGPRGARVPAVTFVERGAAPTFPGPLLRMRVGARVQVSVRNTLDKPVQVRGLGDRVPGGTGSPGRVAFQQQPALLLAPGESRDVEFTPSHAVSSFYYARVVDSLSQPEPPGLIGDIVGALVVDAPQQRASEGEELFLVTLGAAGLSINGQRWPSTPRLRYTEGSRVRWRVINASGEYHPMHLHGFYFQVQSRGDAQVDTVLAAPRPLAVTEGMREYSSMRLQWTAERPGNWLFHCHLLVHSTGAPPDSAALAASAQHHDDDAGIAMNDGMAGLIMGITITPRGKPSAARVTTARRIDLWTSRKAGVFGDSAALSFVVQRGARSPAPDSLVTPSSPLVLTRGELARIVVHNRLRVPLSLHWHGMELDSYYDGVGHFSGVPGHIRPPIPAGDSMEVFMTPPRAGTFMYHIHGESGTELQQGLYGALVVVEPGRTVDRDHERLFLLASRGATPDAQVAINGRGNAPVERFVRGRTYRLRLMHISTNDVKTVRLLRGDTPVRWRAVARDGAALPVSLQQLSDAVLRLDVGQTFDFEWTPLTDGAYVFEVATAPLLSGPDVQRLPIAVGSIPDSVVLATATGTRYPLADTDRLTLSVLTGVFRANDGEMITLWDQDGGVAYSRTINNDESAPVSLVALADGQWVPGIRKAGTITELEPGRRHVLSAARVMVGDSAVSQRVYERIATFPLATPARARFVGRYEQGIEIVALGDSLTLTGLIPVPLPLVPISPSRLQVTFPDGARYVMQFDGRVGPFDGFSVLGVGFSVKRLADTK